MNNPIRRIRQELRLTRRQLCHVAGTRLDAVYLAEAGLVARPQSRLLAFLAQAGYDPAEVVREYEKYRDQLKAEVLAALGDGDNRRPADD